MASFKKTVAGARAKIAKAEIEAFKARMEAIDAILAGATPHDVLTLCAPVGRPGLLRGVRGRIQG